MDLKPDLDAPHETVLDADLEAEFVQFTESDRGKLATEAANRIGHIIAVSPAQIIAMIDQPAPDATRTPPIEIGALVKMPTRAATIYGMVCGLRIPSPSIAGSAKDLKIIEVELLGEILNAAPQQLGFQRGVSTFPGLEDGIYLAGPGDFAQVYAPPRAASVPIGTIHQDATIAAYALVDDLLGKHFSVVGTTGSGKSCAVAAILGAVTEKTPQAHILLIDPHSEYGRAFSDRAIVLSPESGLRLPYWFFTFEELSEVIFGPGNRDPEQVKILNDVVLAAKQVHFVKAGLDKHGTVDTPAPYRMSDVLRILDTAMGSLNRPESVASYQVVKNRLLSLQSDARYGFVFGGSLSLRDDMAEILAELFRFPVNGKPVTIIDTSGVPSDVLNVVVSVICRLAFDLALWSESQVPMTIVCEEAHRYAPRDTALGFEPAKRALSRIAKEGRKYGVSLCVVTQRPSDLAPSLLSECNTMFALRMSNHDDQDIVRNALPEASHGLMDFLPALRNGEAIVVGEGVSMPMRIALTPLANERRPRSATASFTAAWSRETAGSNGVAQTVERWRRGIRKTA